jgi:hypothetical protein
MKAQVQSQSTIADSLLRGFISVFFVIMTIIFLTVPYALSRHPGDPVQAPTNVEIKHLT